MAGPNDFYIENGVLKVGVRPKAEEPKRVKREQTKEPKAAKAGEET